MIRRFSPYNSSQYRAKTPVPTSAPFSGQDLAAALLQQRNLSQASRPSNSFQDNYNYDPILTQIQALGSQSVANAQTNAAQLRKSAGINEGDPELLRSLGFDQNTIDAASHNPQSLLAQLNLDYSSRQKQLEDAMQSQNLYFSGEYQKGLADLASGRAGAQSDLGQKLRDLLSGVDTGVLGAQEQQRQADLAQQLQDQQTAQVNSLYAQLLASLNGTDPNAALGTNPATPIDTAAYNPDLTGNWQPIVTNNGATDNGMFVMPTRTTQMVAPSLTQVLGDYRAKLY